MKKYTTREIAINIGITMLGGTGLLIATIIATAFISSPPSRAEFDVQVVKAIEVNKSVDKRLKKLEDGQVLMIEILTR